MTSIDVLADTDLRSNAVNAVDQFLARAGMGWSAIHWLVTSSQLVETQYQGHTFYARKIGRTL